MLLKKIFFLYCIITYCILRSHEGKHEVEQPRVGNLALPCSQQPCPLLGFGQHIIDKHDTQIFVFPDFLLGRHKNFTEVAPYVAYGITDSLALYVELPIAAHFKSDGHCLSGPEDLITQVEYAFYTHKTATATDQATLVTSLLLPVGDDRKEPPTGLGSPSFFLGLTACHLSTEWYCYASPGVLLTTKHDNDTKAGNGFVYQAGFGKNIAYSPDKWILAWIIELIGTYTQKRRINGIVDQNSGGNVILLGPSIWFSTERLIVQAGIAPVVYEHLFGNQLKDNVFIAFNVGWKF